MRLLKKMKEEEHQLLYDSFPPRVVFRLGHSGMVHNVLEHIEGEGMWLGIFKGTVGYCSSLSSSLSLSVCLHHHTAHTV